MVPQKPTGTARPRGLVLVARAGDETDAFGDVGVVEDQATSRRASGAGAAARRGPHEDVADAREGLDLAQEVARERFWPIDRQLPQEQRVAIEAVDLMRYRQVAGQVLFDATRQLGAKLGRDLVHRLLTVAIPEPGG